MGRKRWRERRGNPLRGSFDIDPWRPHDPEPESEPELPRVVLNASSLIKATGISSEEALLNIRRATGTLLCGADLGDGLTCHRSAGHGPSFTCAAYPYTADREERLERQETERALNAGTSYVIVDPGGRGFGRTARREQMIAEILNGNSYVNAASGEHYDPDQVSVVRDEADPFGPGRFEDLPKPTPDQLAALDDLPPVSNPAPGLWEIVTGKPLPSYAELLERGRRAEHPTYDLLNVQSTRTPQLSSAEACDRLAASIGRTQLARRITEVLPPALASQLALAVDEAVRRGIAEHVATERAVLAGMAEGAQARLAQSIEDQKRGRAASDERWNTPSRLA